MFTKKLIENASKLFTEAPDRILYAYSEYQTLFDDMQNILNLTFKEGLPDKRVIDEFTLNTKHALIILYDLVSKIVQSSDQLHLFSVTSHHKKASVVLISQSLYPPGKFSKGISLNCANFVLFRNPRDMHQLTIVVSQIPGMTKYFNDSYRRATRERFNYLFVDLSNQGEDREKFMLRTGISLTILVWFTDQYKKDTNPSLLFILFLLTNMSGRMISNSVLLKFMYKTNKKQRVTVLSHLSKAEIDVFSAIALNIYKGVFLNKTKYVNTLKPFKSIVFRLGSVSSQKKKTILIRYQKIIPLLIRPVLEFL